MSKMDEMIVVAPRRLVFAEEVLTFHGFRGVSDPGSGTILEGLSHAPFTARRGDVEDDPALLQPIPYVVVVRARPDSKEIFTYTRLSGGGETRLHGRLSIGVGGHMNQLFGLSNLRAVIAEEAARELGEELHFDDGSGSAVPPPEARLIGLINDDTGEVQRVHIGLLAIVEIAASWEVQVRETERLEGHWSTPSELQKAEARARLEEWSVHALHGLDL